MNIISKNFVIMKVFQKKIAWTMKIGILFGLYVLIVLKIYGAYKYYEVNIFKHPCK